MLQFRLFWFGVLEFTVFYGLCRDLFLHIGLLLVLKDVPQEGTEGLLDKHLFADLFLQIEQFFKQSFNQLWVKHSP
jgi:hypothetical protein